MAMTVEKIGTNEDGSPHYHYKSDGHVVMTGPIKGTVTCGDGTVYNVSDDFIEVACDTPAETDGGKHENCHALEVAHLIGKRFNDEGHPHALPGETFVYNGTFPAKKGR